MFSDSFESGLAAWTATGTWGLTASAIGSPTHAVTDSPGAYYASNSDSALSLASPLDLGGVTAPVLAFRHAHALEAGYDFARVEASLDGGANWILLAEYTGTRAAGREQVDLPMLAGQANVRLRFRVVTDPSVVMDGWTIDDVALGEAPAAVVLGDPTAVGRNQLALEWSAYAGADFDRYRILRSTTAGFDWRDAQVVAEIDDSGATSHTDFTVAPKTSYAYRVMVLTTDSLHSLSNEAVATTLAGMDYPFLDNGEGGGGVWVADAPWALSDEQSRSGSRAWSDSPGSNYADNIAGQSLTLSAPLDLSSAQRPVWMFWYKADFLSGDFAYAEVSTNNGSSWTAHG